MKRTQFFRKKVKPVRARPAPKIFSRRFFPDDLPGIFYQKARYLRVKTIPKPSGKVRKILVPTGILKEAQKRALEYLTEKVGGRYPIDLLTCQTAYKRGASAYKNACVHEGYEVSVKFDLKSCFDSIPKDDRSAMGLREMLQREGSTKYRLFVTSVEGALKREGIPKDIARWISDVGTYRGFLYQGSPLSPLLCNIVTKQTLCRRMMKLATVYHLPIFEVNERDGSSWVFVIPYDISNDNKIYVWGLDSHKNEVLKNVARKMSEISATWMHNKNMGEICIEDMVPRRGESERKTILRYAQGAWRHRKPKQVRRILNYLEKSPSLRNLVSTGALRHHNLGKTVYTLYADDGVFSSNNRKLPLIRFVLKNVIRDSGFFPNRSKGIRVMKGCRRSITGFEVADPPPGSPKGARGVRLPWVERDKRYRRKLHHMKTGKLAITEKLVRSFAGSLEYLRVPNPESWRRYAKEFYAIVSQATSDPNILKLVARFKGLR